MAREVLPPKVGTEWHYAGDVCKVLEVRRDYHGWCASVELKNGETIVVLDTEWAYEGGFSPIPVPSTGVRCIQCNGYGVIGPADNYHDCKRCSGSGKEYA